MSPKTPTAPGISALLRKAGFERSHSSASAIAGVPNRTHGYRVMNVRGDQAVRVDIPHRLGHRSDPLEDAGLLSQYADAIRDAGWAVTWDGDSDLYVTAGEVTP